MLTEDPWVWSVDDLVAQICRSRLLFDEAGYGPANYPDPQILEDQLRIQKFAGAEFINDVDDTVLRNALGVQHLGQRQALLAIVRLLRSRSHQYKRMNSNGNTTQPVPHSPKPSKESFSIDPSGRTTRRINVTNISQPITAPELQHAAIGPPVTDVHTLNNENYPGQWDYLLDRYGNGDDDEVMDLYGDQDTIMDEEDGYDSDEEEEPMDAMHIDVGTCGKLSEAEVTAEINDCIAQFTVNWYPGKVNAQDQPVHVQQLLAEAESGGRRKQLAKKIENKYRILWGPSKQIRKGDPALTLESQKGCSAHL